MKPETAFYQKEVKPNLIHFGVIHRIENVVETGTPDVSCCMRRRDGSGVSWWVELKFAAEWPKRANTLFRFPNFELEQAMFIEEWGRFGNACVLAKVAANYFVMPSYYCGELRAGMTKRRIMETATVWGTDVFPTGRIVRWLTQGN